jgi:hypothetical protein
MQDMPQDFFRPEFYMRRKHLIERRIQDLTTPRVLGLVKPNIEAELKVSYQHNYGKSCRPIEDWKLFGLEQLLSSTKTLTDQQLILVMRRLLENFNENRKGLPDLFLIDATGKPRFVEVKSEKEKIAEHQLTWLSYLRNQVNLPVEICRVIDL